MDTIIVRNKTASRRVCLWARPRLFPPSSQSWSAVVLSFFFPSTATCDVIAVSFCSDCTSTHLHRKRAHKSNNNRTAGRRGLCWLTHWTNVQLWQCVFATTTLEVNLWYVRMWCFARVQGKLTHTAAGGALDEMLINWRAKREKGFCLLSVYFRLCLQRSEGVEKTADLYDDMPYGEEKNGGCRSHQMISFNTPNDWKEVLRGQDALWQYCLSLWKEECEWEIVVEISCNKYWTW